MKKMLALVPVSVASLLMVSCMSLYYSTKYKDADIRIATDARIVAGMQFVRAWTVSEPTFTASAWGRIEANRLAEKGLRSLTLLVEQYNANDRVWLSRHPQVGIWQISIYQ